MEIWLYTHLQIIIYLREQPKTGKWRGGLENLISDSKQMQPTLYGCKKNHPLPPSSYFIYSNTNVFHEGNLFMTFIKMCASQAWKISTPLGSENNSTAPFLVKKNPTASKYSRPSTPASMNPLGAVDLKFDQSQRLGTFWGLFYFLLNQSFICHGNTFSSFFTILLEHMSLWPQCNIVFGTTKFMML